MSSISFFQQYSKTENVVTNNTLLLFSHLNRFSPSKFELLLNKIVGQNQIDLLIGTSFSQQIGTGKSVADGYIEQQGFKIVIETKMYDNFDISQLINHLNSFKDYKGKCVLLALSRNKTDPSTDSKILNEIKKLNYKIIFASISYKTLINNIRQVLSPWDDEIHTILDDYLSFCDNNDLFDYREQTMLVVTINQSYKENLKYNLYYDPAYRSHNIEFGYLGLYADKEIKAIGKVVKTAYCNLENGKLVSQDNHELNLTDEEANRIIQCINNTTYYDLQSGSKFILVDHFYETHFRKDSPYPIRQKQYFYLDDYINNFKEDMATIEIAKVLNEKSFE